MDNQELVARVFVVLRDFPDDFDAPAPIDGINIEALMAMSEQDKNSLLARFLEFARIHQRPRPIDEVIRHGTFLL